MIIEWQIIGIVISIILNIVLAILLFFKSALNDILKDWCLDRKKKREEAIKRLVDFKSKFGIQQSQSFIVVLLLAQKQTNLIMGKPDDPLVDDNYQRSLRALSEARNAILEYLDYLPDELRKYHKQYDEQFSEIIQSIMKNNCAKEDVTVYSERMTSLSTKIVTLTDSMLRQKLD